MGAVFLGGELGAGLGWGAMRLVDALGEGGRRLRHALRWRQEEAEMDEELRFHLEMEAESNVREGMSEAEARRLAAVAFGGGDGHRERIREARGLPWLDDLWRDLRYAATGFRRDRLFTLISVGMLAVAIGVNSALIGLVDFIALSPVPGVASPSALAALEFSHVGYGASYVMPRERLDYRDRQTSFTGVGGVEPIEFFMEVEGGPVPVEGLVTVGDYFEVMRFDMTLGRALVDAGSVEDDRSLVLSHRAWKTRFNGSRDVLGRSLRINDTPMTIVGVMPADFDEGSSAEFWVTSGAAKLLRPGSDPEANASFSRLWGRLKPGITREQAQAEASSLAPGIAEGTPPMMKLEGIRVVPPTLASLREVAGGVAIVGLLTTLILAIAASNVGGLLIGRGLARRQEVSVRVSVGASRQRIVRQLLTEGVLLAFVAAAVALIALGIANEIFDFRIGDALELDLRPSWRTVALTLGVAGVTALLFSLTPALNATRDSLRAGLAGAAGGPDPRSVKLQRGVVVIEFALSMALGCATGLIVNSIRELVFADQGYEVSERVGVVTLGTRLTDQTKDGAARLADELARELAYAPGTLSATFGSQVPGRGYAGMNVLREGRGRADSVRVMIEAGGPDFLRTLGIPLLEGRDISAADVAGAPRVVVVGDRFAQEMWPDRPAVGRTLRYERFHAGRWVPEEAEVVGVSASLPLTTGEDFSESFGGRMVFLPALQVAAGDTTGASATALFVRQSSSITGEWAVEVRRRIASVAPGLPIDAIETTRQRQLIRYREGIAVGIGAALGGMVALAMAAVGVFAAITFRIEQRRRELGVRQALGATSGKVTFGIFREGLTLALLGFLVGLPLGLVVLRVVASQVSEFDSIRYIPIALISLGLLAVAAVASWLPARRVTRIHPIEALRS